MEGCFYFTAKSLILSLKESHERKTASYPCDTADPALDLESAIPSQERNLGQHVTPLPTEVIKQERIGGKEQ